MISSPHHSSSRLLSSRLLETPLQLSDLIRLHFHRNCDGAYHCPVTYKIFNRDTHIVAIKTTGNVYAYDAIESLCIKMKSMRDLLDDSTFMHSDIITIQDPHSLAKRDIKSFAHIKDDSIASQVNEIKNELVAKRQRIQNNAMVKTITKPLPTNPPSTTGPARAMYSSGAVSSSFTSTATDVSTNNERQILSPAQIREQWYAHMKKSGKKGYARLHTSVGNINLELHCDIVPKTCHNFLELCEKGYYKGTKFHRLIPGFMIQGGDPTGTGTGGAGAFTPKFNDEFHPSLTHIRGTLAMANSGPNTNGSQFYIMFDSASHLDNKHTVFGRCVGGMEVLDIMEQQETWKKTDKQGKDMPKMDITINDISIYTNPFSEPFVPHDELTREKANQVVEEEEEVSAKDKRFVDVVIASCSSCPRLLVTGDGHGMVY